ncbi:MAG: nitroreductase family protein [Candidatus Aegiribacteria sp.]|nr:nitroreductase family protein [Candidatus Aegiribacteria sp.]
MNAVLDTLKFRHACKKFDPEKKISPEQLENIIESAHLLLKILLSTCNREGIDEFSSCFSNRIPCRFFICFLALPGLQSGRHRAGLRRII